jgi:hypothetical protein
MQNNHIGRSNDDEARSVVQTGDGGYIVAGYTRSNDGDVSGNHGGADAWVVKLNSDGTIAWQKTLGGSSYDEAHSIVQTSDGGYIVAGYTRSNDGDVSGNHGEEDAWVVKLDSEGNIEWQKTFGGSSYDEANSIVQTSDGGYIVAGYTKSSNGDVAYGGSTYHGGIQEDVWVIKLDSHGNIIWQEALGGGGYDRAFSIAQTSDDGYVVAGYAGSNDGDVSGNHGSYDVWVVKLGW